ncbi:MAG TPA: GxxExxY protein [Pyrinomonadaceae bacterium]|nr:GxxExxY protein [Chloracidobacterium sp.]MBP9935452.1 GxxExxY protein [Pyrinomonadaceae bacterium]MBK7801932.1 GxxExxY protein [Chloracidobacterium sp.]MBK9437924.1 GxxExxY protein [Chloracidobacterium sp.]MBK9765648.1 GxxExxY protein [Chloracidobacterium sp.]
MEERILHKDLSYKIVGLAMQVHTELAFGFLEKVYENALMVLFEENGIKAVQQMPILVPFHGKIVGEYVADIVVEDSIIIELKAQDRIAEIHKAQTLNYLKATSYGLALLVNFGKYKLEYERLVL